MEYGRFLMFIVIFIVPLLRILTIKLWRKMQDRKQQNKLPPGPRKLPFLGNLHQLFGDFPHNSLERLSKEHGPLMFLQLGSIPTLVISSSDVARDIFKSHDLIFSDRPQLYVTKRLSYEGHDISFVPYGEYWREVRKIVVSELLSVKRVQSFRSIREDEVGLMINSIAQCSPSPVNLNKLTLSLTNNILCRVAFGKKYDGDAKRKFYEIIEMIEGLLGEFNVADFYPVLGWLLNKINGVDVRLEKSYKGTDEFLDKVIEEHCDATRPIEHDHEALVDVLLRLQKDPKQTSTLTNIQVKAILSDLFQAASDTSSATLVWIMAELVKNPLIMKKAQDEIRHIIKGKQRVEESDLPKLIYLKLVIKETLRLHTPSPLLLPRETRGPCKIGEYEVPSKTRVIINAKAIAMDPNVWDNPNKFEPERFVHSSIDYKGNDFEIIPFGVGRRGCPGINFVVLQIEIALANLLYCFDWSFPNGMMRDNVYMAEAVGMTPHKNGPLLLSAVPAFAHVCISNGETSK